MIWRQVFSASPIGFRFQVAVDGGHALVELLFERHRIPDVDPRQEEVAEELLGALEAPALQVFEHRGKGCERGMHGVPFSASLRAGGRAGCIAPDAFPAEIKHAVDQPSEVENPLGTDRLFGKQEQHWIDGQCEGRGAGRFLGRQQLRDGQCAGVRALAGREQPAHFFRQIAFAVEVIEFTSHVFQPPPSPGEKTVRAFGGVPGTVSVKF